jgi:ADP-dependent NAD(P)H-hydrate dehydratase / NAD(P)H-hydrate epimerase
MKILTSKQIRQADSFTIENEPISSINLMERACRAFVQWFITQFDATIKVGVVCGTGNNGGDGLGIARMLIEWGYDVKAWVVRGSVPESSDFKVNLERLRGKSAIQEISSVEQTVFAERDVIIDAVFGSGLSRPVEGVYSQVIKCINAAAACRIAVDIPSGLQPDGPSSGEIVKADYTVSFQLPKLAFLLPQSYQYTGEWLLVDIGLQKKFIKDTVTDFHFLQRKDASRLLKPRSRFDHKGSFGHALIVSGSFGKMGACVLATRAALRSGPGLVTVHAPACGYTVVQATCPEAMFIADSGEKLISAVGDVAVYSAIGIGPGIGQDPKTVAAFRALLRSYKKPMVIDADALNILAGSRDLLDSIPPYSILTPHPKEFDRLAGTPSNDWERLDKQRVMARELNCVVLVKGAYTSIATPSGKTYFNSTGNPGMATGGTGDVLTGILTGILAQGYNPEDAVRLGVYLHGLAGDLVSIEKGEESLLPSDIIETLPAAFKKLKAK